METDWKVHYISSIKSVLADCLSWVPDYSSSDETTSAMCVVTHSQTQKLQQAEPELVEFCSKSDSKCEGMVESFKNGESEQNLSPLVCDEKLFSEIDKA